MEKISMEFIEGMLFHGRSVSEHDIFMDSVPKFQGRDTAPRPMECFIHALAGCTGMDVVSILRKMKILDMVKKFEVQVEYERATEHPKVYTKIHVTYYFETEKGIPHDKVEKACVLSQERYCPASAMLKKAVPEFDYEIKIVEIE